VLCDPGQGLNGVVEAVEVLDVHGGDDVDPGVEDLLDVLPAFDVAAAGHVGVGQLVDQCHGRSADDDGVGVQLLEGGPPVGDAFRRDLLKVPQLGLGDCAVVGVGIADNDISSFGNKVLAYTQHGVGLAHTWGRSEDDTKLSLGRDQSHGSIAPHSGDGDEGRRTHSQHWQFLRGSAAGSSLPLQDRRDFRP